MKRTLFCLLALALLSLCASACAQTTTLLVYMCGATIQEAACEDIVEMAVAETDEDVNVVILAGGAEEWAFDELEGNTRNLVTLRDGYFESIEDWGWMSMGDGESLLEFLKYGFTEYPADRNVVILWNHGAGSEAGMCFDATTEEEDGLSLTEINDALYDLHEDLGGFHIDVFGCDACMMATYEMAAMLSRYDIDYLVASEEIEPGLGWNYTPWLEALDRDGSMTNAALCEMIVNTFVEAALAEDADDYLALSAIDLNKLEPLRQTMEDFSAVLLGALDAGNISEVTRGRSQVYTLGSYADGSWDMVDMGAMLDAYAKFDPGLAARARRQLDDAVLISRQAGSLSPCSGLSVLIPQDTKDEFEEYVDGLDLSFYMPNWIGFVKSYAAMLREGSHSFPQTQPQQVSGTGFLSQLAELLAPEESYGWDADEGEYTLTEHETQLGEGDYAFTATLSPEELQYLDYVEGMLMVDASDEEFTGYVDFGLFRNNLVDWQSGSVYSLFDGTWPVLDGQMVALYDQMTNEYGRRSLIPVKLNGEYTYLVAEFRAGETEGRIVGANAGYDEGGLPIRATTQLKPGDSIVPVYTLYYDPGDGGDMEEMEFDGDEIAWRDGLTVRYEDLSDEEETLDMLFCFVLNDVFGDYTLTDAVAFEL